MHLSVIIFILTLVIYIPLAGVLLYVWHKFGRGDKGVRLAQTIYLLGSFMILGYMIFV